MDIYDEFVDAIRELVAKIITHDFDQVFFGNGQPMSQGLRETVILFSRPIVPGENLTYRNVTKEDLVESEDLFVTRDFPKPPLYLNDVMEDSDEELPPLDRSQISNWEVDGIRIYSNEHPQCYFTISVCVNVTPNEISCDLIHIY